ncbi:uncharacterized protein LOC123882951 [Trifolium pratense]|uniref:Uncharacterized protein n=1 Tax=Trifolium pratense TaxID=57577 RepID=A0ACB0L690_TRIPR|nr:uncharacterized protein LOC123882951 [Trifolium pratense]CAJ2662912.1 unnamed protein product [Trifolium pratense]
MELWESRLLSVADVICERLACGLHLPLDSFRCRRFNPLVSTGMNLEGEKEGKILEIPHWDYNLLSVQEGHKYVGLNLWSKKDQKVEINIHAGHLAIIAGKQLEQLLGGKIIAPKHESVLSKNIMKELEKHKDKEHRNISSWRITSTLFTQQA